MGANWTTWLILAGRGFGKTRAGAEWCIDMVQNKGYGHLALVAEDAGDARDVMVEGESGIMACSPPWFMPNYEPSKKRLTWPNGARATIFSAEDPEALRGPQHDCAWLDELCKWKRQQDAFDQLQFGLRLGISPRQVITTTPRPTPLLKDLIHRKSVHITKGSTYDNIMNLAPTFQEQIKARYEGTRLGRQELEAEILDDNPNALFHQRLINAARLEAAPEELAKTVVAVDPAATGNADSDETGIIVASKDLMNPHRCHYYVQEDRSVQGRSPEQWASLAVSAYHRHRANYIVAEVNNGGDMVESVIKQIDNTVRVVKVRASKGKWVRAEPTAGLYEQGRVHHCGKFSKLEDQMCDFDPSGEIEGKSPDRMDALVWAITDLMGKGSSAPSVRSL